MSEDLKPLKAPSQGSGAANVTPALTCPVCYEDFPAGLSCSNGHRICLPCGRLLAFESILSPTRMKYDCPLCRTGCVIDVQVCVAFAPLDRMSGWTNLAIAARDGAHQGHLGMQTSLNLFARLVWVPLMHPPFAHLHSVLCRTGVVWMGARGFAHMFGSCSADTTNARMPQSLSVI